MAYQKIATCCYCGTKAALVLRGTDHHELTCSSCGAPMSRMKSIKAEVPDPVHHYAKAPKVKKAKKKKSKQKKLLDFAFDVLDDIFD